MSEDGGLVLPRRIGWGALLAIVGLAVQAGIGHYRVGSLETQLAEYRDAAKADKSVLHRRISAVQEDMDRNNEEELRYLRRVDKFICKLCTATLTEDDCSICDK